MATTHHVQVRPDHVGVTGRRVAAGVAAAACAVVISSIGSPGATAVVDLGVESAEVNASNLFEPVSVLLDGAAFEVAVRDAIAFVTNGSALLDGPAFADAVATAVAAATNSSPVVGIDVLVSSTSGSAGRGCRCRQSACSGRST